MNKRLKKIISASVFLNLFFILMFSQAVNATNTAFERINNSGMLIVGMSGEQPPFNFVSSAETVIGYDMDLADMLSKSLGVKVRIELMPFSQLMDALKQHKIDVIISGFAFSEERSKALTFIGPYALSGKSLVITQKRLKEIQASTGLNHESVHLMALQNSTSQSLAKERLNKAKLTPIKHYEDAILALRSGDADALVADLAICELAVIRDSLQELTTLKKPLAIEEINMAISNDEPLLGARLSEQLQRLNDDGTLKALHKKWFNDPGWLALLP